MVKSSFGQFLVNSGVLDEKAVYEAMNLQMKKKVPIGQIAVKERVLTIPQVFNILNKQERTKKFFGEIAVDLGYLVEDGVEKLLAFQRESIPGIEEVLVKMKKIDKVTCTEMLEKYQQSTTR